MKHELRDGDHPCRKQLLLHFDPDEVALAIAGAYRDINNMVRLPGFRRGKAPRRMLEKRFGGEAGAGARQWLIDNYLAKLIKEEKLRVMGPLVDRLRDSKPVAGEPYDLELEMFVEPEFQLPEYVGLSLEDRRIDVSEDAVDAEFDRVRLLFSEIEPKNGPAGLDDILTVDYRIMVDGMELKNGTNERIRISGDRLFDLPCPQLIERFEGAKPGDAVDLSVTLPDDHPDLELRGKAVEAKMGIKEVSRVLLPEPEAIVGKIGLSGSVEDFRNGLRQRLVEKAMGEAQELREDEIVTKLLGAAEYQVHPEFVRKMTEDALDRRRQHLASGGYKKEFIESDVEKNRPAAVENAVKKLRWEIMARRIAEKEGISATDEDMARQIESLSGSYGISPQKMARRIRELGGGETMRGAILGMKVIGFVIKNAKGGSISPNLLPSGYTGQINAEAARSVNAPAPDGEQVPAAADGGGVSAE